MLTCSPSSNRQSPAASRCGTLTARCVVAFPRGGPLTAGSAGCATPGCWQWPSVGGPLPRTVPISAGQDKRRADVAVISLINYR